MYIFLRFLSVLVAYIISYALSSDVCSRMRPIHNVTANISECKFKTFSLPVPAFFCIEYCDSLDGCIAVAMEMGQMTSWCCAFENTSSSSILDVCHGNETLIYSAKVELFRQNNDSCSGESNNNTSIKRSAFSVAN